MFGIVLDIFRSGALLGRLGDGRDRAKGAWVVGDPSTSTETIRRLLIIACVVFSSSLGVDTLAVVSNLSLPRASCDSVVDAFLFGLAKLDSKLLPKRRYWTWTVIDTLNVRRYFFDEDIRLRTESQLNNVVNGMEMLVEENIVMTPGADSEEF